MAVFFAGWLVKSVGKSVLCWLLSNQLVKAEYRKRTYRRWLPLCVQFSARPEYKISSLIVVLHLLLDECKVKKIIELILLDVNQRNLLNDNLSSVGFQFEHS